MRILLAIFIPPLAVLLCGRIVLAAVFAASWFVSFLLCGVGLGFFLLPLLSLAAMYVVIKHDNDKRQKELIAAMAQSRQ